MSLQHDDIKKYMELINVLHELQLEVEFKAAFINDCIDTITIQYPLDGVLLVIKALDDEPSLAFSYHFILLGALYYTDVDSIRVEVDPEATMHPSVREILDKL